MNPKIIETPNLPMIQPARIRTMNGLIPLKDIEEVDGVNKIWKGSIVKDADQSDTMGDTVYFSREYDREKNDLDRCLREHEVDNVLDFKLFLIPKEKCMFIYEPPSTIIKPATGLFKKPRKGPQ